MRARIVAAIVENDLKDLVRNPVTLPLVILPPLLALLTGRIPGERPGDNLPLWIVYAQVLVGLSLSSLGLAEEKEKKTLEALMVSPATFGEIILGKTLFSLVVTLLSAFLVLAVSGGFTGNMVLAWLWVVLGSVLFIEAGLIVGFYTQNQKSAGALDTPIMLVFMLAPALGAGFKSIKPLLDFVPSVNLLRLLQRALEAGAGGPAGLAGQAGLTGPAGTGAPLISAKDLISLLVWTVGVLFFTLLGMRRQQQ